MTLNRYITRKLAVLLLVFAVVLNLAMPGEALAAAAPPEVTGGVESGFLIAIVF